MHLIYCTYPIGGDHTAYTPTALLLLLFASRLVVLQKRHRHLSGLSDNFYLFVTYEYEFNASSNNGSYELKSGLSLFVGAISKEVYIQVGGTKAQRLCIQFICFAWTFEVDSMVSCFTLQGVKYSAMKQFKEGCIMSSTKQGDTKEEEERMEERRWREYLTQPKGRATSFTGPTTHAWLLVTVPLVARGRCY